MLDLKAKLAAAGLVSREALEAEERRAKEKAEKAKARAEKAKAGGGRAASGLDMAALASAGKGARYEAIRRAVEGQRLDSPGPVPSASAEPFHFTAQGGGIARIYCEPRAQAALAEGAAGVVAFMSNHGLAHAAVPRALAADVGALFPLWLRVLNAPPGAGQIEGTQGDGAGGGGA